MIKFSDYEVYSNPLHAELSSTPGAVSEYLAKAKIRPEDIKDGPKALMHDPLSVQYAMGFKERRNSVSYDMLRRIPRQLALISAVIQTRCQQVSAFGTPYRLTKSLGFEVKHRDPGRVSTKGDKEFIKSAEAFIYNCGVDKPNPHNPYPRDDFETFLKKIVQDSLTLDQATFEIVRDRVGTPYEFMAVDAATIRLTSLLSEQDLSGNPNGEYKGVFPNGNFAANAHNGTQGPYRAMKVKNPDLHNLPMYAQYINGQLRNTFTRDELVFGVRNPRTDIYAAGYGQSELEMLVTVITSHLYAEEYNRRFFMQGSAPKGILNVRGESFSSDALEDFKRQWVSNVAGVTNAWKTPILQSEGGLEWIDLNPSNQEMEYSMWIEYLIKITCAVFLIDPAELNFDMHGGVQQTPLFESSQEWKLKASRDRGLKPMLRFIAKLINDNIIVKLDPDFMFDFVGLDELSQQEKHELLKDELSSYKTFNEVRREKDLPDVPGGDVIGNPVFTAFLQQSKMAKLQEDAQKAAAGAAPAGVAPAGGDAPDSTSTEPEGASAGSSAPQDGPAYSDGFTKSSTTTKFLSVAIADTDDDDWLDVYRSG